MGRSAAATDLRSSWEMNRIETLIKCTTQVCTTVLGKVASMASGKPVSPSTQAINTSCIPRLRSSANTPAQNLAPSDVCTQMPSTCLIPSQSTPTAMWAALLRTWLDSLTFTTRASKCLVAQLGAQRALQMGLNIPDCHAARIQRNDHVGQPAESAGALGHQLRLKAAIAVPRGD